MSFCSMNKNKRTIQLTIKCKKLCRKMNPRMQQPLHMCLCPVAVSSEFLFFYCVACSFSTNGNMYIQPEKMLNEKHIRKISTLDTLNTIVQIRTQSLHLICVFLVSFSIRNTPEPDTQWKMEIQPQAPFIMLCFCW